MAVTTVQFCKTQSCESTVVPSVERTMKRLSALAGVANDKAKRAAASHRWRFMAGKFLLCNSLPSVLSAQIQSCLEFGSRPSIWAGDGDTNSNAGNPGTHKPQHADK